jgi:catechol 2,3-dioxygenase-like lactoylglutathione lyase family enzyme
MTIENALAGVAVRKLSAALPWYQQLLGQAAEQPMPGLAEWTLPQGGCLQIFEDAERAGSSSATLVVSDLDGELRRLKNFNITAGDTSEADTVKTAIVKDADGNQVVLVQSLGAAGAGSRAD